MLFRWDRKWFKVKTLHEFNQHLRATQSGWDAREMKCKSIFKIKFYAIEQFARADFHVTTFHETQESFICTECVCVNEELRDGRVSIQFGSISFANNVSLDSIYLFSSFSRSRLSFFLRIKIVFSSPDAFIEMFPRK